MERVPEPLLTMLLNTTYSSPAVKVDPMLPESVVCLVVAPMVKFEPSPCPDAE